MAEVFSPFSFGQIVNDNEFTNRVKEKSSIKNTLMSGNSVILISPRRIGKSSLIKQVYIEIEGTPKTAITQLDITSFRSERQFLEEFAIKVVQANHSKYKSFISKLGEQLRYLVPVISFKPGGMEQISFSFNWSDRKKTTEEILRLPETLTNHNGKRQLIAIDEFQNISRFDNSEALQYELRSYWQHQSMASYCLFGSRRHMMEEIFTDESAPFYNFGQVVKLKRIERSDWIPFILSKFKETSKPIPTEYANLICDWTQLHTEYMQYLSHLIWVNTAKGKGVAKDNMMKGLVELMNATSIHAADTYDKLSNLQISLLKAILSAEEQITSSHVIQKYNLKSSASVLKAKKALLREDLIEQLSRTTYRVINPTFELWFRMRVMKEETLAKYAEML